MKTAYIKRVPALPSKWWIVGIGGKILAEGTNEENLMQIVLEKGFNIKGEL